MAEAGDYTVAVLGSGLIGRSYSMLFASAGYQVLLYDIDIEQINRAKDDIKSQLQQLEEEGLLRGSLSREDQYELIRGVTDLKSCVEDAFFVLECVPERLEIKQNVWKEAESFITRDDVILSSSTSALLPSDISRNFRRKERFVVSHPAFTAIPTATLTRFCRIFWTLQRDSTGQCWTFTSKRWNNSLAPFWEIKKEDDGETADSQLWSN